MGSRHVLTGAPNVASQNRLKTLFKSLRFRVGRSKGFTRASAKSLPVHPRNSQLLRYPRAHTAVLFSESCFHPTD